MSINKCKESFRKFLEESYLIGAFFYPLIFGGIISIVASMMVSGCSAKVLIPMLISMAFVAILSYFTKRYYDRYLIKMEEYKKNSYSSEGEPMSRKEITDYSKRISDSDLVTEKSYDWICFLLFVAALFAFSLSIYYVNNEQDANLHNKMYYFKKVETLNQKIDSIITVQQEIEKDIESSSITQDSLFKIIKNANFSKKTKKPSGQANDIKKR